MFVQHIVDPLADCLEAHADQASGGERRWFKQAHRRITMLCMPSFPALEQDRRSLDHKLIESSSPLHQFPGRGSP